MAALYEEDEDSIDMFTLPGNPPTTGRRVELKDSQAYIEVVGEKSKGKPGKKKPEESVKEKDEGTKTPPKDKSPESANDEISETQESAEPQKDKMPEKLEDQIIEALKEIAPDAPIQIPKVTEDSFTEYETSELKEEMKTPESTADETTHPLKDTTPKSRPTTPKVVVHGQKVQMKAKAGEGSDQVDYVDSTEPIENVQDTWSIAQVDQESMPSDVEKEGDKQWKVV